MRFKGNVVPSYTWMHNYIIVFLPSGVQLSMYVTEGSLRTKKEVSTLWYPCSRHVRHRGGIQGFTGMPATIKMLQGLWLPNRIAREAKTLFASTELREDLYRVKIARCT